MEKRSWEAKILSHLTEMIEEQMLCTGRLHRCTALSSSYTFSLPAQGQGVAARLTLKAHKGSCPNQQRVSGVGKLCVATPHFQAAGMHTAGETLVPVALTGRSTPPKTSSHLLRPRVVPETFRLVLSSPWLWTQNINFCLGSAVQERPKSPGFYLFYLLDSRL